MPQNEILQMQALHDKKGNLLTSGYARHMNFTYDKKNVRFPALRLKEWDFYQVHFDERYVLQLTVGHVSYCTQISATLLDIQTGVKRQVNKLRFGRSLKKIMPLNPEVAHALKYFDGDLHVLFEVNDKDRRLAFTCTDENGVRAEINLLLTNVKKSKDKMVIATPFDQKPREWYLNYKENCFVVNGSCRIDDVCYDIHDGFGLLDWGRGVWPYKHSWTWGNGGTVVEGKHFGFNIGWGFGNTENATENMFFYDNKAYKLGEVKEMIMGDNLRYVDEDKRFVFDVEPIYDNVTKTKVLWVNNTCHQQFGLWKGRVVLDDGTKIKIPPFVAFCEHAENKW